MTQTGIGFAIGFLSACSALWDRIAIRLDDSGLHLRRGVQVVALSAGAIFLADGVTGTEPALRSQGLQPVSQTPVSDFEQSPAPSSLSMIARPCGLTAVLALLMLHFGDLNRQGPAGRSRSRNDEASDRASRCRDTDAAQPSAREQALELQLSELENWRIRLERQSQKLAEIADQSMRERAVAERDAQQRTRILAAMSHELRTPLNAIIGFSDVMQLEVLGPIGHRRYRDYASHINDSGQALLNAIRSILELIEADRLAAVLAGDDTVAVANIIDSARRTVNSCHPEAVLEVGPVCRTTRIAGDAAALRQAVTGLISAAAEKTPEGSRLQIATRNRGDQIEIRIGADLPAGLPVAATSGWLSDGLRNRLEIALARSVFGIHGGAIELGDVREPEAGTTTWLIGARLPMAEPPFPGAFSSASQPIDLAAPPLPVLAAKAPPFPGGNASKPAQALHFA